MVYGYAISLVLIVASLAGITLEKAYFYLPAKELERRADKGDSVAQQFLSVIAYGNALRLLLVAWSWLAAAAAVVVWVRLTPLAIASAGALIILVVVFFWQIRAPLSARGALFAAWCTPVLRSVLNRTHQILAPPARLFARFHLQRMHTGLYELDDVTDFLERQKRQRDSRISLEDLNRAQHVLAAGRQTVGRLMTPRAQVRSVNGEDQISPVLQDELYASGQALFPVYEGKRSNIVGTLRLSDIADVKRQGQVLDAANRHLAYLRQDDSIERAVRASYETHQELFIVLDDHAQYAGILTVDAILAYVFGPLDQLQFGHFDDPTAMAHKTVAKNATEVVK